MSSAVERTFKEVGNAIKDAYGHVVHGDDAGTSEIKVLIVRPQAVKENGKPTHKFDLGMTFLNVNDRAFVHSVDADSEAARVGIQAQDCLQLAVVLAGDHLDGRKMKDSTARKFALEGEANGKRTSYHEFKKMFQRCTVPVESNMEIFDMSDRESPKRSKEVSLSRKIRFTTQELVGRCSSGNLADLDSTKSPSSSSGEAMYPVVLVFKHTYKRHAGSSQHVGIPYFRLDDECERAASMVRRLAPSDENRVEADMWDEIMQKYISPNKSPRKISKLEANANQAEVSTIRGLIQNALGLAFVRTSKVVLGLSFHFGTGIVISRLEDGTWSAPSAIGMYGAGLGVQFGLEVADYIFILQTEDALKHFRQGSNYTVGGNVGAAVGGIGREAYGAASVGSPSKSLDPRNGNLAPIVAYAKSQGLYFGVSLEGSKIFARDEINRRAYKFHSGRECTTQEILSGLVPPPREAEDLYASLHSIEFAHEIINLPRPPALLNEDLENDWDYYSSTLELFGSSNGKDASDLADFEAKFKNFMYGGISVQRIAQDTSTMNSRGFGSKTDSLERRTLWLMLPDVGSLRLGYVSKKKSVDADDRSIFSEAISEGGTTNASDEHTAADESTIGGTTLDSRSTFQGSRVGRVKMSKKYSMALSDVVMLKRISNDAGNPNDDSTDMRIIIVEAKDGNALQFITNTVREAELIFCGLKLLLERECAIIGRRRSGISSEDLSGNIASAVNNTSSSKMKSLRISELSISSSATSDSSDNETQGTDIPEGRQSWSQVPSRGHLKMEANANQSRKDMPSSMMKRNNVQEGPVYHYGQLLIANISSNFKLDIPLALYRALILDSNSPLMNRWETNRGDLNYSKTAWVFAPSSPRNIDSNMTENLILSSGSMVGGHRTTAFDRIRGKEKIRLSEVMVVDTDSSACVGISIAERMPRRGFAAKVKLIANATSNQTCQIDVIAEIVPVGKDLSNQGAVHRAYMLLVDELTSRYGAEKGGLLSTLVGVISSFPKSRLQGISMPKSSEIAKNSARRSQGESTDWSRDDNNLSRSEQNFVSPSNLGSWGKGVSTDSEVEQGPPSMFMTNSQDSYEGNTDSNHWANKKNFTEWGSDNLSDMPMDDQARSFHPTSQNITIDVKPLPKIRLDLMPSPREEDEDNMSASVSDSMGRYRRR